jgi:hypothetical protein
MPKKTAITISSPAVEDENSPHKLNAILSDEETTKDFLYQSPGWIVIDLVTNRIASVLLKERHQRLTIPFTINTDNYYYDVLHSLLYDWNST